MHSPSKILIFVRGRTWDSERRLAYGNFSKRCISKISAFHKDHAKVCGAEFQNVIIAKTNSNECGSMHPINAAAVEPAKILHPIQAIVEAHEGVLARNHFVQKQANLKCKTIMRAEKFVKRKIHT